MDLPSNPAVVQQHNMNVDELKLKFFLYSNSFAISPCFQLIYSLPRLQPLFLYHSIFVWSNFYCNFDRSYIGTKWINVVFCLLCMKECLLMKRSYFMSLSYCYGRSSRRPTACIRTASHNILSSYFLIRNETSTCFLTFTLQQLFNHWKLYGCRYLIVYKAENFPPSYSSHISTTSTL